MRLPTPSAEAPPSHTERTVDSTIHYLAPACDTEKLIAEAKEVKYGSKVAVYEVNIFKDDGTIVATSMQSYFITEAS